MADKNTTDLNELINKVEKNQVLLPDFQRDFVWKDEEQQKQFVASVLCKMPVGSILLLEAEPDDYAAKVIGCAKKEVDTSQLTGKVEFLLDGQQRITVLANVFSNVIHDNCPKVSELIAPMALKRRFFLKLPKWKNRPAPEDDWFGIGKLEFPIMNPNASLPDFLTSQIISYIHVETFSANDGKPYNPSVKLSDELERFCLSFEDGYLIPLFLLTKPSKKSMSTIIYWLNRIMENISRSIMGEIEGNYAECVNDEDKEHFIRYIFGEEADEICGLSGEGEDQEFKDKLSTRMTIWNSQMKEYLDSCICKLSLHQIIVTASQRARAIDIYENLNLGGICLNTFDLLMARVAKVNKENFNQCIKRLMMKKRNYPENVLPSKIRIILAQELQNQSYNATDNMKCYNKSKNELSPKYIDIFLDVLGIYSYVKDLNPDLIKLDYIKKNAILSLRPEAIDENCEKVIEAIDRAMFFLQTRCGIRTLQEVNYSLVVVLIAVLFIDDENFKNQQIHNLLEGWYWAALFSGEYDKDQNTTFISNLRNMLKTVKRYIKGDWIKTIASNVFAMTNFSDKKLLLMDKATEDRYPKKILTGFVCQYMLAQTYSDMFDSDRTISVFSEEASTLQNHHIIPLGTVKKVGQTTEELRKMPQNICNSPLNYVMITKKANIEISDAPLDIYAKKITPEAKVALYITSYTSEDAADTDAKIHKILEDRFEYLKCKVLDTIKEMLMNWM